MYKIKNLILILLIQISLQTTINKGKYSYQFNTCTYSPDFSIKGLNWLNDMKPENLSIVDETETPLVTSKELLDWNNNYILVKDSSKETYDIYRKNKIIIGNITEYLLDNSLIPENDITTCFIIAEQLLYKTKNNNFLISYLSEGKSQTNIEITGNIFNFIISDFLYILSNKNDKKLNTNFYICDKKVFFTKNKICDLKSLAFSSSVSSNFFVYDMYTTNKTILFVTKNDSNDKTINKCSYSINSTTKPIEITKCSNEAVQHFTIKQGYAYYYTDKTLKFNTGNFEDFKEIKVDSEIKEALYLNTTNQILMKLSSNKYCFTSLDSLETSCIDGLKWSLSQIEKSTVDSAILNPFQLVLTEEDKTNNKLIFKELKLIIGVITEKDKRKVFKIKKSQNHLDYFISENISPIEYFKERYNKESIARYPPNTIKTKLLPLHNDSVKIDDKIYGEYLKKTELKINGYTQNDSEIKNNFTLTTRVHRLTLRYIKDRYITSELSKSSVNLELNNTDIVLYYNPRSIIKSYNNGYLFFDFTSNEITKAYYYDSVNNKVNEVEYKKKSDIKKFIAGDYISYATTNDSIVTVDIIYDSYEYIKTYTLVEGNYSISLADIQKNLREKGFIYDLTMDDIELSYCDTLESIICITINSNYKNPILIIGETNIGTNKISIISIYYLTGSYINESRLGLVTSFKINYNDSIVSIYNKNFKYNIYLENKTFVNVLENSKLLVVRKDIKNEIFCEFYNMDISKPFNLLFTIPSPNDCYFYDVKLNTDYNILYNNTGEDPYNYYIYNPNGRVLFVDIDSIDGIVVDNVKLDKLDLTIDPFYFDIDIKLKKVNDKIFKFDEKIELSSFIESQQGNISQLNLLSSNPDVSIIKEMIFGEIETKETELILGMGRPINQIDELIIYYNLKSYNYEILNITTGESTKVKNPRAYRCLYTRKIKNDLICVCKPESNKTEILNLNSDSSFKIDKTFNKEIEIISVGDSDIKYLLHYDNQLIVFNNNVIQEIFQSQIDSKYTQSIKLENEFIFIGLDIINKEIIFNTFKDNNVMVPESYPFIEAEFVNEFKCTLETKSEISCFVKTMYNLFRVFIKYENEVFTLTKKAYNNENSKKLTWTTVNYHVVDSQSFIRVVTTSDNQFRYMLYSDTFGYSGVKELGPASSKNGFLYSFYKDNTLYLSTKDPAKYSMVIYSVVVGLDNNYIQLKGTIIDEVNLVILVYTLDGLKYKNFNIKLRTMEKKNDDDDNKNNDKKKPNKRGTGFIVLIFIGTLTILALIGYVIYFLYQKNSIKKKKQALIEFAESANK